MSDGPYRVKKDAFSNSLIVRRDPDDDVVLYLDEAAAELNRLHSELEAKKLDVPESKSCGLCDHANETSRAELIEDIRQAVRTELLVGDKPLSRQAGVLRDVGCEMPGWPVNSNKCRSAVHDILMNLLDRLHSEDGDAEQYDCLIVMASVICAFAEHIKREGALK